MNLLTTLYPWACFFGGFVAIGAIPLYLATGVQWITEPVTRVR